MDQADPIVAPLAGARIEMYLNGNEDQPELVAPLAGARIEILKSKVTIKGLQSLPSRERGLKFQIAPKVTQKALSLPSRERGLKSDRSSAAIL